MHKVTASAVILTAITGCSQNSNIPSSQWSFEVPSGNQTDSAQSTVATRDWSFTSELSADAKAFVEEAGGSDSANIPSSSDPANRELISTASQSIGAAGVTSSRPDPVAQVRAYLQSSVSPSALTNRNSDASLVYLSSSTPQQSYNPEVFGLPPASSGVIAPRPDGDISSTNSDFISTAPVNSGGVISGLSNGTETANAGPASSVAAAQDLPNVALANTFSAPATTLPSIEDDLPHLTAATPVALLPVETQSTGEIQSGEIQSGDNVPIGTAILRGLQQPSGVETSTASSLSVPVLAVPVPAAESLVQSSDPSNDASADGVTASVPIEAETEVKPTLARLTQGIPEREGISDASLDIDELHSRNTDSPLLEGLNSTELQSIIYVPISESEPTDTASKLIQAAIAALAEDASTTDGIDKLTLQDTFSSVLSSAAFFGSQASASLEQVDSPSEEAVEADAQSATLKSLSEETPVSHSVSQLLKTPREDAGLAIRKQISKRRQLITWR